ncbi:hypothetical protein [Rhizobium straminoryzae]|uniref:Uncharacterized protein n=1 Tax=Rhizobium straminoryzae TaxID=1387186 RepID=A0A549TCZ4_9HYPH|nr:hypothetical protein [Rhizobium straminoryzae]TRL39847.1 hypothetical protein FNA46_07890 [Rhizobium straminoryzae]
MIAKIIGVAVVPMLVVALLGASYAIQTHIEQKTIRVQGKERLTKVTSDSDRKTSTTFKNFVYSDDEVYVVEDSLWNGHFIAMTVYSGIKIGATCRVTLSGYRFGFLSMYQNIIAADCVPAAKGGAA